MFGRMPPANPEIAEVEKMRRHPIESNFYVNASDAEIAVTFAPTRSLYTFTRAPSENGTTLPYPAVQHLGRTGDTGDYEPAEVQAMACRVALATVKRLHLKQTVIQLWPCDKQVVLAKSHLVAA
jgi:hypothetical protein